jgi:hypothetical protein
MRAYIITARALMTHSQENKTSGTFTLFFAWQKQSSFVQQNKNKRKKKLYNKPNMYDITLHLCVNVLVHDFYLVTALQDQ